MKFPILSRTKRIAPLNMDRDKPAPDVSPSTQDSSTSQIEKERTISRSSRQNSQHEGEKSIVETAPLEEAEALEKLSDEPQYPSGPKL